MKNLHVLEHDDDHQSVKPGHCSEYFDLFTTLVSSSVHAGLTSGLSDRIVNLVTGDHAPLARVAGDDVMLVGLLNILTALISAERGGSGASIASSFERKTFLRVLFHDFLMALPRAGEQREPRCQTPASRDAAFKLLHALVHGEPALQHELVSMLSEFVHRSPPPLQRQEKGWGFEPDWEFDASAVSDTTSQPSVAPTTSTQVPLTFCPGNSEAPESKLFFKAHSLYTITVNFLLGKL